MKCDELKRFEIVGKYTDDETIGECYDADEVDAAIAEIKADNERLKKCEIWMKQHFYCEEVIACESAKNRKLKRALWLARANNAESQFLYWCARLGVESGFTKVDIRGYSVNTKRRLRTIGEWIEKWKNVKSKCRAKAEEYK